MTGAGGAGGAGGNAGGPARGGRLYPSLSYITRQPQQKHNLEAIK